MIYCHNCVTTRSRLSFNKLGDCPIHLNQLLTILFSLTQFKALGSIQDTWFYSNRSTLFQVLDFIPGARLYCKDSTLPRYSTLQFARIYLVCSTHIIIYCFFPCGAGVFFIKKIWLYETFSFNARSPLYRSIEILIYIYIYVFFFFLFYLVN